MKKTFFSRIIAVASDFSKTLALVVAVAAVAVSCVNDSLTELVVEDLDGMVRVEVDATAAVVTRSATRTSDYVNSFPSHTLDEDNTIYNLWIVQFDEDGSTRIARYISDYTNVANRTVSLYPGVNQKFIYVANTSKSGLFSRQMTYEEILNETYNWSSKSGVLANISSDLVDAAGQSDKKYRFVMSKIHKVDEIKKDDATHNNDVMSASLTRNVALLQIAYGTYAPTAKVSVQINNLQLFNVPQTSAYLPTDILEAMSGSIIYPAATSPFSNMAVEIFDTSSLTDDYGLNLLRYYVPVNIRGEVDSSNPEYANWTWSNKFLYGEDNMSRATKYTMEGKFDDGINTPGGRKWTFDFTEYLGGTQYSFDLFPNTVYDFDAVFPADLTLENIDRLVNTKNDKRITYAVDNTSVTE